MTKAVRAALRRRSEAPLLERLGGRAEGNRVLDVGASAVRRAGRCLVGEIPTDRRTFRRPHRHRRRALTCSVATGWGWWPSAIAAYDERAERGPDD